MRVLGRSTRDFKEHHSFVAALSHTLSDPITEDTRDTEHTGAYEALNTHEGTRQSGHHGGHSWTVTVRDCQNKTGNVTLTQTQRRTNHGQKGKDTWRHVEETNKPDAKLESQT